MLLDLNMNAWYNWILCVFLLILGIFFLVKFSDIFVGGSASLAKKLHISPMIIGLTVVAFGTSCPELAVSVILFLVLLKVETLMLRWEIL